MRRFLLLMKYEHLMKKIEKTEKKLCKYVSKFLGKNVVSVSKYSEQEEAN